MNDATPGRYEETERLRDCVEVEIAVELPAPLSGTLDAFVNAAEEAGERTNRKEMLAALILATTDNDVEELTAFIEQYRHATVRDAIVPGQDPELVQKPIRARGPRRRRRGRRAGPFG